MCIGYLCKQGISFSSDFMTFSVHALLNTYDHLSLYFSHFIKQETIFFCFSFLLQIWYLISINMNVGSLPVFPFTLYYGQLYEFPNNM